MKTFTEVEEWRLGAVAAFGDASVPVCQLFFRWSNNLQRIVPGDDTLACGLCEGEFALVLGPDMPALPLPVRTGEPDVSVLNEEVITYGAVCVVDGVWAINPSLNLPGVIHGFVVVYGVPDPEPWKQLIVLPSKHEPGAL